MEISLFMIHMFDFTKICVAYQKDDCVSKERLDLKKKSLLTLPLWMLHFYRQLHYFK